MIGCANCSPKKARARPRKRALVEDGVLREKYYVHDRCGWYYQVVCMYLQGGGGAALLLFTAVSRPPLVLHVDPFCSLFLSLATIMFLSISGPRDRMLGPKYRRPRCLKRLLPGQRRARRASCSFGRGGDPACGNILVAMSRCGEHYSERRNK